MLSANCSSTFLGRQCYGICNHSMIIINHDILTKIFSVSKIFSVKSQPCESVGRVGWAVVCVGDGQTGTGRDQQHKPVLENPSEWTQSLASHAEVHQPPPPPLPPPPPAGPEIPTLWRGGRVWGELPQAKLRCRGFSLPERRETDI